MNSSSGLSYSGQKLTNNVVLVGLAVAALALVSCDPSVPENQSSPPPITKAMNKKPTGNYTGHVIAKPFVNKVGQVKGPDELYLRLSMGDYLIKFSESVVSAEDLKPMVNQVITVEGEIRDGELDIGPDDPPEMQSRIGSYFVITKLL